MPAMALEQTDPRQTSSFRIKSAEATKPPNQRSMVVSSALSMAHLFASLPKYRGARTVYGMIIKIVKTAVKTRNAIEAGHGITNSDELYQSATRSDQLG